MPGAKKLTTPILLVGTPIITPDIRYATRFSAPDPVVYLQHKKSRYLLVNRMEAGRARRETKGLTVLTPEDLSLTPDDRRRLGGWALGLMAYAKVRRVVVPAQFPLGIARHLEHNGRRVDVHPGLLFPGRRQKSKEEIAFIRCAQRAAVAGYRAAASLIAGARADRRGTLCVQGRVLTADTVRRAIHMSILEHGCHAADTIVAGGRQGADPHSQGHGPLKRGVPIVIDIFPQEQKHGYWGDLTRTVIHGEPTPELERMYQAVRRAQSAALAAIRAGAACADIHGAAQRVFDRSGYKTGMSNGRPYGFIHSTGHGVGLEIHEAPTVSGTAGTLLAGDVVTVEPGLYYEKLGGIRIEDTVVVTPSGYTRLASCPKQFRLA